MKIQGIWLAYTLLAMAVAAPARATDNATKKAAPAVTNSTLENRMKPAEVKKITALLFARELEPCIEFWTKKMGFQKTVEVPEGDKIGFVILEKDGMEVMYQSISGAEKDNAATGKAAGQGPSFLYIEVADIDATFETTKGAEITMPMRTTFYQSKEFGIKDPAGHYFIFAQQGAGK